MVESSAPGNGEFTASTPAPPREPSDGPDSGLSHETSMEDGSETSAPGAAAPAATPGPTLQPWGQSAADNSAEPIAPEPAQEVPAPEPTPAVASAPALEPQTAPATLGDPTFLSSIEVPANPEADNGGGGEWELLVNKIQHWLQSGELQGALRRSRTPLLALGAFLALVLVLRVYGALLGAIDSLPLVGGLLELTGVIWLARFGVTHLVRSRDRQALLSELQQRWNAFLGSH
ncbi:CAAD domain-containing protein [Cyanobium sp. Morenito 9A2]|uniref:CAAD domain-containing protein n=1 Tax=Cyanobium sp. Morenito 9A2 TaxID=2823718 RepID=UPI0020CF9DC7|nr:CAAD domain-containing protein [Cyanobium sp. Morenito 9A2]MCP9850734.1 hypothetical protein [Cyanobium sp. Morenito 9A2]